MLATLFIETDHDTADEHEDSDGNPQHKYCTKQVASSCALLILLFKHNSPITNEIVDSFTGCGVTEEPSVIKVVLRDFSLGNDCDEVVTTMSGAFIATHCN